MTANCNHWTVYALRDGRDDGNYIRYVGCTNDLERRIYQHQLGYNKHNPPLMDWIEAVGSDLVVDVLERGETWDGRAPNERKWLDRMKADGHPLFNQTGFSSEKKEPTYRIVDKTGAGV